MSTSNNNNDKGILQEIMDEQRKLDRTILKDRDLFNMQNQPDLMANFDDRRKQGLFISYTHVLTAIKMIRAVGAKWWKNQPEMTQEQLDQFVDDSLKGKFINTDIELSNTSMKIMAIIQELVELEDAINEGKDINDIHDEYIDIIHFMVSLGLDLGLNSEQKIKELYLKKNKINHLRQECNY